MGKQASAEKVLFGDPTTLGSVAGVLTLDLAADAKQKIRVTLTEDVTSVVINDPTGAGNFIVEIVQDATGLWTLVGWPSKVNWPSGAAPVFGDAGLAERLVGLYFNGPTVGTYKGDFSADTYS